MTSSHNPVSLNDYKQPRGVHKQMKAKLVLSRQIHTALPHARPYITQSPDQVQPEFSFPLLKNAKLYRNKETKQINMSSLEVLLCACQTGVPKLNFFPQRVHLDEFQETKM